MHDLRLFVERDRVLRRARRKVQAIRRVLSPVPAMLAQRMKAAGPDDDVDRLTRNVLRAVINPWLDSLRKNKKESHETQSQQP